MIASTVIQADLEPFVVGVISDTHIPDRVDGLHPYLLEVLQQHKVNLILHGGDISRLSVIQDLKSIAPVLAVTGNRDYLLRKEIPNEQRLNIYGSEVVLVHGHHDPKTYWIDKFQYITSGYVFERYQKRLQVLYPEARVIVFGHTHHPENLWVDGKLFFNPGAVSHGDYLDRQPYFGMLRFYKSGRIDSEILPLLGARIRAKKWLEQR